MIKNIHHIDKGCIFAVQYCRAEPKPTMSKQINLTLAQSGDIAVLRNGVSIFEPTKNDKQCL
jgi:hypothetical protein